MKALRDLKKKYKEGLRKILQSPSKINEDDVRLGYLRVVEIKMKLTLMDLENEREEVRKNEDNIIKLDED